MTRLMKTIPILILHGWNLSAEKFIGLQEEFKKKDYKVFCLDLPGFGKEKPPQNPLYLSDYVKFISDFLRKRKISKIILIGHSFGGRIGIKLAAERPELLHSLILTGAPGITPVPRSKVIFFIVLAKFGKKIFSAPIIRIFQKMARQLLYRLAHATDFYNTNEKMRDTFKNIVKENLEPYLPKIKSPTLLLWGAEDKIIPLSIAQRMQKLIKNSKLETINNARHGAPWTHAKEFADDAEKFLEKI